MAAALCLSLVPRKEAVRRLSAVKCEVWRSARHQKRGFKSCFSTVAFPTTTIVLSLSDSPDNPEKLLLNKYLTLNDRLNVQSRRLVDIARWFLFIRRKIFCLRSRMKSCADQPES